MIIAREGNAIKRVEAVKQRGGTTANRALIQDSPGVSRAVVADGALGVALGRASKSLPRIATGGNGAASVRFNSLRHPVRLTRRVPRTWPSRQMYSAVLASSTSSAVV